MGNIPRKAKGRINGYLSRVRVGRGSDWEGHQGVWAGAVEHWVLWGEIKPRGLLGVALGCNPALSRKKHEQRCTTQSNPEEPPVFDITVFLPQITQCTVKKLVHAEKENKSAICPTDGRTDEWTEYRVQFHNTILTKDVNEAAACWWWWCMYWKIYIISRKSQKRNPAVQTLRHL